MGCTWGSLLTDVEVGKMTIYFLVPNFGWWWPKPNLTECLLFLGCTLGSAHPVKLRKPINPVNPWEPEKSRKRQGKPVIKPVDKKTSKPRKPVKPKVGRVYRVKPRKLVISRFTNILPQVHYLVLPPCSKVHWYVYMSSQTCDLKDSVHTDSPPTMTSATYEMANIGGVAVE